MNDAYGANQANQLAGQLISAPTPSRPLDRIGHAADRIMAAYVKVGEFLDRYHGPMPTEAPGMNASAALAVSYSSNLERLFGNIETLEARLQSLTEIG